MNEMQRKFLSDTLTDNIEDMLDGMEGIDKSDIEHVQDMTLKALNKALDEVENANTMGG